MMPALARYVPWIDRPRTQREQPLERSDVVRERARLIVDDDGAGARHEITGEQHTLLGIPEAQAFACMSRRFQSTERAKDGIVVTNGLLHAWQIGVADQPRTRTFAQRHRCRQMIDVPMGHQDGCDRPTKGPRRGQDGLEMLGIVRTRIDCGQLTGVVTDQVRVCARKRHRPRVRREHTLQDHRAQNTGS